MEQIMKKFIKLAAAVSAALATQYASAGVILYGDGGSINMPGTFNFQVASVYENVVTAIHMKDEDMINLKELVSRFINFAASKLGLFYDQ